MDLRVLRYFLAVAREESMTKAAQSLHVTQPTLSKQLKSLEEELGKKLFLRHAFSIELTEEGRLLRKRAEDLLDMADKIANEFSTLDDATGGELYFGLAESYQISFLAQEIKRFKRKYPSLHFLVIFYCSSFLRASFLSWIRFCTWTIAALSRWQKRMAAIVQIHPRIGIP